MKVMLLLLAVSTILELLAVCWLRGGVRKAVAALVLVVTSFASGGVALYSPNVATGLLVCLSLYRIVNLLRVVEARMNEAHLRRTTCVTAMWLIGLQVAVLAVWRTVDAYRINGEAWLAGVFDLQLLAALVLLASTLRHLRTTKLPQDNVVIADKELPTVTVAIPARNEDEQLEQCLQTVLASDYPKLEVLVLDDCSQDRTPEILRQFAHDGVRFILGSEPKPNWLAKNQAYERLANEASGELLLFCGVDVRFGASTIRNIVTNLVQKKKSMVSVMPQNDSAGPSLPQLIRYVWELALPRRMFNRPPVLSSCWLVKTTELKHLGGFAAVSHSITPEAHFARGTIVHDGYSFLRSDDRLGLTSTKTIAEQRATAIRTRYPQLHRRPELVVILSLLELAFLVGPFVLVVVGLWGSPGWSFEFLALAIVVLLLEVGGHISFALFPRNRWLAAVTLPLAALADVALLNYSMWQYEFSEVIWKGRNVCLPVMRATIHSPKERRIEAG